ncbi:CinA family protein [Comamonas terrigena]|uniref:CinA family protein n=1 Tax=Comamonas terrigena TaxID=32013 RepID=UPI00244C98ED|nr:CinA family protein [Comamonas terrigena]MDH1502424.1 CinA family protein [Comamonas terrigena]
MPTPLHDTLSALAQALVARGWMMATAESCTGGLIAAACTDLPGSSRWLERGFVTYSNAAKTELLGVPAELIAQHGAVSEPVARAMAAGAARHAPVQACVAVTGVAGPDGGSADKPVGTVWFGWSVQGELHTACLRFAGDRAAVRQQTRDHALQQLLALVAASAP